MYSSQNQIIYEFKTEIQNVSQQDRISIMLRYYQEF